MNKYIVSYNAYFFVEADDKEHAITKACEEIEKGNIQLELEDVEEDY
jgi:DNA-directed RNA polymerase subunit K/omega